MGNPSELLGNTMMDNDYEDITKNIMCCLDPEETTTTTLEAAPESSLPPSKRLTLQPTVHHEPADTELQFASNKGAYSMFLDRVDPNLKPVPHNRFSGWTGHTYSEAVEFCNSRESDSKYPCSYESLCPDGTRRQEEKGKIGFFDGPVWMPINDEDGEVWVEL